MTYIAVLVVRYTTRKERQHDNQGRRTHPDRARHGAPHRRCRAKLSSEYHNMGLAQLGEETSMQPTGSILVVDSETTISDLILEVLTDEGYVAYSAPDGRGALAAIASHAPALMLLDLDIPDMSGAALIAQVRLAGLATMPIVLMSTSPDTAAPLLVLQPIECLAKPFDLGDLLARVARYMQPAPAVHNPLPDSSGVGPLRQRRRYHAGSLSL
jgi:CheY-like chemotaxis protein